MMIMQICQTMATQKKSAVHLHRGFDTAKTTANEIATTFARWDGRSHADRRRRGCGGAAAPRRLAAHSSLLGQASNSEKSPKIGTTWYTPAAAIVFGASSNLAAAIRIVLLGSMIT